jgi:hypothetical protein
MHLLPKQIRKEEYHYYSDKSVEDLKTDIQQLFKEMEGWSSSANLTGEFVSEYEFVMTPKWQLATRAFERETPYLDGQIFRNDLDITQVAFTVRPNSIFVIFFFAFPLFGFFALMSDNVKGDKTETVII